MKSFIQTTIALLLPYISFAQEKDPIDLRKIIHYPIFVVGRNLKTK